MKNSTKIGVWMDHSFARLLEPGQSSRQIKTIESGLIKHPRIKGEKSIISLFSSGSGKGFHFSNNEYAKNHIHRNKIMAYYKKLEKHLEPYDQILLVGSTHAKDELYNLIKNNKSFKEKNIVVQSSDYLTPKQFAALVKCYLEEKEGASIHDNSMLPLKKPDFMI